MTNDYIVETLEDAIKLIKKKQAEIERLKALVDEMSDYFPACIGCEGKTTLGERTDECVYLIDNTEYCAKRGIENIGRIMKENTALKSEIERLELLIQSLNLVIVNLNKEVETTKSEAIKEFAEKIDQLFYRYAHLRSHADCARKDYIKADDGTEIEMQSVWDVFTLKKYGIAEYEEMNRLQTNIELIEKGRLLAELQKDFKLLVKEMTEGSEK